MRSIYGLRAVAISMVCLFHGGFPVPDLMPFFFIVSGFMTAITSDVGGYEYTYRKVKKTYPYVLFSQILALPQAWMQASGNIDAFLTQENIRVFVLKILMLESYFPLSSSLIFRFNGLSWFISSMTLFWIVIPWVGKIIRRMNLLELFFFFSITLFLIYYLNTYVGGESDLAWWFTYISPYFRLLQCMLGFISGLLFLSIQKYIEKPCRFSKIRHFATISSCEIIVLCEVFFSFIFGQITLIYIGYIFLLFVLAHGNGIISWLLGRSCLVQIGKISMNIYWFHLLIINYFYLFTGISTIYSHQRREWLMIYIMIFVYAFSFFVEKMKDYYKPIYHSIQKENWKN